MTGNVKKQEQFVEIPGLEITRVNLVTVGDFKLYTCLTRVVTDITPLKDYAGFKTCKFQDEPYVIYKKITNSIYLEGTNERELIEVQLIPYDEFIKIPIKDKELIKFGIQKKDPKVFVPGLNDELEKAKAEIEKLKKDLETKAAAETKGKGKLASKDDDK
jgi:hypothetical protein